MKRSLLVVGVGALILVAAFYALNAFIYEEKQAVAAADYLDAAYMINGERVTLVDGVAETEAAPGSASKVSTHYLGNDFRTDLDGDGREDVVFMLTQNRGGTGVFYYVVGALNTARGYVGSDAYYLGDRVAPQNIGMSPNPRHVRVIVANYADREAREPMTAKPSVGKSVYLKLDPASMRWGIVEPDFEGESNLPDLPIVGTTWQWISARSSDGRELTPPGSPMYTLTFDEGGTNFVAFTDCNTINGTYVVQGSRLEFTNIAMTKKFCEGSLDADFAALLRDTSGYHFSSDRDLILDLKSGSGTVRLRHLGE